MRARHQRGITTLLAGLLLIPAQGLTAEEPLLSAGEWVECPIGTNSEGQPYFAIKDKGKGRYQLWCNGQMMGAVRYNDQYWKAGALSRPEFDETAEVDDVTQYLFTDGWSGLRKIEVLVLPIAK